ncbi:MAG: TetR/AcrR family transcriptional regulator [Anaerolineae bacterium]|nr:TetR/AcrR family transcriptional regulator [Anaerolineae bacterium]
MSHPDLRQRRTREALQQALVSLIQETNFEAITVADIADRAGVARKTFYAHYQDKDVLLIDYIEPLLKALAQSISNTDVDTLLADNKPASYPAFKHVQEHAAFYRVMLGRQGSAGFITYVLEFMTSSSHEQHQAIWEATSKSSVEPMLIAHFLAGALLNTIIWWLKNDCQPSAEIMAYTFSRLAAPGVLDVLGLD